MNLFTELKRRNVFRVALFYIVSAWVVIQVAETLLPVFEVPDSAIRAMVLALALGFPLVVVFAWVFELTPDGLKLDKNAQTNPPTRQQTSHKLNWATLIAAVLAIGLLVTDRLMPETAPVPAPMTEIAAIPHSEQPATSSSTATSDEPDPASIAVLPFADLSPDGDQGYFSDGIAEEILNVLAGVDGLAVASRTSSFQFKGVEGVGIPRIADQLDVRHILEGSVRSSGRAIRVTAQLIDASRDQHLWSETWDRELTADNLFAIQDDIASAIVASIRENLDVDVGTADAVPQRTSSIDAYTLFLRARSLFRSRAFFSESYDLVQRAIDLDPKYTDALALKAAILVVSPEYGVLFDESAEQSRLRSVEAAERALAIDPGNALALGVLGLAADLDLAVGTSSARYSRVINLYDQALAANPDELAVLNWRGFSFLRAGFVEQSKTDFRRCMEIEPGYAPCSSNLVAALTLAGQTDEALELLDRAIRVGVYTGDIPSLVTIHQLGLEREFYFHAIRLPSLRGWLGMEEIYRALEQPGGDYSVLIQRLKAHGDQVGSRRSIDELLIALGEHQVRPPTWVIWFDAYRNYRASDQFKQHIREWGLLEYWQTNGFPPMCRPVVADDGEDDFECD